MLVCWTCPTALQMLRHHSTNSWWSTISSTLQSGGFTIYEPYWLQFAFHTHDNIGCNVGCLLRRRRTSYDLSLSSVKYPRQGHHIILPKHQYNALEPCYNSYPAHGTQIEHNNHKKDRDVTTTMTRSTGTPIFMTERQHGDTSCSASSDVWWWLLSIETGKRGGSIDFATSGIRFNGHINVARRLSRNRVRVPSSGLIVATSKLF